MFKNDYLEQQIENLCQTFAALALGKELTREMLTEEMESKRSLTPSKKLTELLISKQIKEGNVNAARNAILSLVNSDASAENFRLVLKFYNELNELEEKVLNNAGVSKQDLKDDILKIRESYITAKNLE